MKLHHEAIDMNAKQAQLVRDLLDWWEEQGNAAAFKYLAELRIDDIKAEFHRQIEERKSA